MIKMKPLFKISAIVDDPQITTAGPAGEDVDPSLYYCREALMFEAPPGKYEWLNRLLAVGTGQRSPNEVIINAFEIL